MAGVRRAWKNTKRRGRGKGEDSGGGGNKGRDRHFKEKRMRD